MREKDIAVTNSIERNRETEREGKQKRERKRQRREEIEPLFHRGEP